MSRALGCFAPWLRGVPRPGPPSHLKLSLRVSPLQSLRLSLVLPRISTRFFSATLTLPTTACVASSLTTRWSTKFPRIPWRKKLHLHQSRISPGIQADHALTYFRFVISRMQRSLINLFPTNMEPGVKVKLGFQSLSRRPKMTGAGWTLAWNMKWIHMCSGAVRAAGTSLARSTSGTDMELVHGNAASYTTRPLSRHPA